MMRQVATLAGGFVLSASTVAFAWDAIWDKSSGPSFVARHGMSSDDYQKAFDQLVGKDGFQLVWVDVD